MVLMGLITKIIFFKVMLRVSKEVAINIKNVELSELYVIIYLYFN